MSEPVLMDDTWRKMVATPKTDTKAPLLSLTTINEEPRGHAKGTFPNMLNPMPQIPQIFEKAGRIGIYTKEERSVIIAKFYEKRKRRVWNKKIRYNCRKNLADRRVRVKGRFVRAADREKMMNEDDADGDDGAPATTPLVANALGAASAKAPKTKSFPNITVPEHSISTPSTAASTPPSDGLSGSISSNSSTASSTGVRFEGVSMHEEGGKTRPFVGRPPAGSETVQSTPMSASLRNGVLPSQVQGNKPMTGVNAAQHVAANAGDGARIGMAPYLVHFADVLGPLGAVQIDDKPKGSAPSPMATGAQPAASGARSASSTFEAMASLPGDSGSPSSMMDVSEEPPSATAQQEQDKDDDEFKSTKKIRRYSIAF
jgi:hypothetical protein